MYLQDIPHITDLTPEISGALLRKATKEVIEEILKQEPDILNDPNQPSETPLMLASKLCSLELCSVLIKHDDTTLQSTSRNDFGENILHVLAKNAHLEDAGGILEEIVQQKVFSYTLYTI